VAANVKVTAICAIRPVRMMVRISPNRSAPAAAKMSTPARVGTATLATRGDTAARITSIQTPDQIAAHRVRPPARLFSAVWPTEPPTGRPPNNPDTRLPAP
jgi:hypothetical protein